MRILLVNGNTSDEVTQPPAEVARDAAGSDTEIVPATGAFGVQLIGHRAEAAIAEHAVLELIAEHADDVDGVLIGVSRSIRAAGYSPSSGPSRRLLCSGRTAAFTHCGPADGSLIGRGRAVWNGAHGMSGNAAGDLFLAEMQPYRITRLARSD